MKKNLSLLILLLSGFYGVAQRQHYTQGLYWLRYQNQLVFSPVLFWTNEIDNRRFFSPDVQHQLIVHSRVHFRRKEWDFAGGLTGSFAYAAIPENGPRKPLAELRPVIETSYEFPFGKMRIQNRIRLDNRFLQQDPDTDIFSHSLYVLRFRYRIQGRFVLRKDEEKNSTLTLRIGDEIMFNHIKNTFDQNRVYINFERAFSSHLMAEAGYMFIHQQRFGRDEFFNRHVVRLSITHRVFMR